MKRYTLLVLFVSSFSCGNAQEGLDKSAVDKRFGETKITKVIEPIDYTDQPYTFTGTAPISDIYSLIPESEYVWYGLEAGSKYSISSPNGTCDKRNRNKITALADLPKTIEGVVTLHPRYFQKIGFCDHDERFYGSYILQDSTRGILILKDSRIADFTYGDRVKLRVRGLVKFFDTFAVLVHDEEEVVSRKQPVYFKEIAFRPLTNADIGENLRVKGRIAGEPTNSNFNEMCLVAEDAPDDEACSPACKSEDNCSGYILVSLDREIGQREPGFFKKGDVIEVTGPSVNNYGNKLLVARMGQLKKIKSTPSN